jgi:CspA family cold shock protein
MSLIVKLIISLVIAIVVSTLTTLFQGGSIPDLLLLAAFSIATVATALIVAPSASTSTGGGTSKPAAPGSKKPARRPAADDSAREQGQVKWFNVSKGFGFITKDDGEEIFVHFRSIRGEGRRSLRDGQRVSFVVAQSDKGPQAEDVEGVD